MIMKKRFSFEDDPSFSGHDEKWWEEWDKNNQQAVPASICVGCLNQVEDGGCDVFNAIEQRDRILAGECYEHII